MPEKRPHPPDGIENGDTKRSRAPDGSPAPASNTNGLSDADRKKQEAAAKIAAIKAKIAAAQGPKPVQPAAPAGTKSADEVKREAAERVAAIKARLAGGGARPATASPAPVSPSPAAASPGATGDGARRVQEQLAAMKARLAAQRSEARAPNAAPPPPPARDDNNVRAKGGLGIGLHPALMGDLSAKPASKDKGKRGTGATQAKVNPYLSTETQAAEQQNDDATFDPSLQKQRDRKSRAMVFNQKGKFIAQAESLRNEARLEKMRQDMQAEQRKKQIEEATERSFLVQAPPDIEWWDEGLVNGSDYSNLDAPDKLKFDVITEYVQHPVLLEPPQEKNMPAPKPMHLTKKEQAKLRRQRRMEDHKEEQAKIRLGLIPPPPPKVKKSNLMRVLGQEAVKDPTAVEARVNREIAQRAQDHEAANEERKLSKDERHEKLATQQETDAARGIRVAVFRIENLSYGKHRYQIDVNARQNALSGTTILHPKMNLVIVEGGAHSVSFYKKLMLNRIKWGENAPPVGPQQSKEDNEHEWLSNLDERGAVKDLGFNKCTLVWEGDEKARAFRKWGSKVCETDGEAKDFLSRSRMENMWTLALGMQ